MSNFARCVKFCQVPIIPNPMIATTEIHQYASPCVGRRSQLVDYCTSFPYVLLIRLLLNAKRFIFTYICTYYTTYIMYPIPFTFCLYDAKRSIFTYICTYITLPLPTTFPPISPFPFSLLSLSLSPNTPFSFPFPHIICLLFPLSLCLLPFPYTYLLYLHIYVLIYVLILFSHSIYLARTAIFY